MRRIKLTYCVVENLFSRLSSCARRQRIIIF